jgi:peptide/nickel transport system substrate-binding protein
MEKKEKISILSVIIIVLSFFALFSGNTEAASKPKPEGTLTVAINSLAEEGFLPDRCSGTTGPLWEAVYDFLIYSDTATQKTIPGVAERWEYSKDYRTITFFLRKGIKFHDGWGELTAEDVKYTIELNARKTSTNLRSTELRMIKDMEMPDRYTLVIHLKEPDAMFWFNFCTIDSVSLPILCKKYIEKVGEEKANRQPIGSGPYKLVEQKIGDFTKFEALDDHWLVVPEYKYLNLRIVSEESTRVAMLKTGMVDIAYNITLDNIPELQKMGFKSVIKSNSELIFMPFGGMLLPQDKRYVEGYHRTDPWKDVRVREAMSIAIDRASIVKNLYHGYATAAPIFAPLPGWEKLEPIPYNPKRAKQLLVEAGYPNGFSFKIFSHVDTPMLPLLVQTAAGYWDAIGLKAEIVQGDYATWRTTNKSGKTAGYLWGHAMGNFSEWAPKLVSYELPNASTPLWQSEETSSAIKKFVGELDPQKKEGYLRELARVYRNTYAHVPLVYAPRIHETNQNVGAWSPSNKLHPKNFVFARHAKPLNTYRLFTP